MLVNSVNAGRHLLAGLPAAAPQAASGRSPAAAGPLPFSMVGLSPAVSDALLRIAEIINGEAAAKKAVSDDPGGYVRSRLMSLDELPPGHAERLKPYGADGAVRRTAPDIPQAEFEKLVMAVVGEGYSKFEGFDEAVANGTLQIRKASDVPELGYETVLYDLYKGGQHAGGVAWGASNTDAFIEARRNGIHHATGSINGHDFVVTWAMPWEAHNHWLGTL